MLAKSGDYMLFLDKGYTGVQVPEGVTAYIPRKVYCGREPAAVEKELNRLMSGIRGRIEHVNGFIKKGIHGDENRYKRSPRMEVACMLKCFIYNVFRHEFVKRNKAV